jgi:GNAT superfamily N-acetyltransferase
MIRMCREADFDAMYAVINDAAEAYRGVIPADCWHEPYMPRDELKREIAAGIVFWGWEAESSLLGVMGIQDKGAVTLIRHAYVRTAERNRGIGGRLLRFLEAGVDRPILIGTWAAATWAVTFYRKHGYRLLPPDEKDRLLRTYWTISDRQVETSVVLASAAWRGVSGLERR